MQQKISLMYVIWNLITYLIQRDLTMPLGPFGPLSLHATVGPLWPNLELQNQTQGIDQ